MAFNTVYILLGSNLGDREGYLRIAMEKIQKFVGEIIDRSSIYETEPWGFQAENGFLNRVLKVKTTISPIKVLMKLQEIETSLGRIRKTINGYRCYRRRAGWPGG